MTRKARAEIVVRELEKMYPDPMCTLDYDHAYQLLISVRLAAQCTDARVNIVTKVLFERYKSLEDFAAADLKEITEIVRPCGLGPTKAKDIVAMSQVLLEKYNGVVPDDLDELLTLPGIGRKSANLIVGDVYGKPAVVVDTHCLRVTNLLGLASSKSPVIVEKQLREILPPEKSNDFCHRTVLHGRAVCVARSPRCHKCGLKEYCKHGSKL